MRLAIGRISDRVLEYAEKFCKFAREIYRKMIVVAPEMEDSSDMKTKMDTMLQSIMKIENSSCDAIMVFSILLAYLNTPINIVTYLYVMHNKILMSHCSSKILVLKSN
jgi:hypothetical protein